MTQLVRKDATVSQRGEASILGVTSIPILSVVGSNSVNTPSDISGSFVLQPGSYKFEASVPVFHVGAAGIGSTNNQPQAVISLLNVTDSVTAYQRAMTTFQQNAQSTNTRCYIYVPMVYYFTLTVAKTFKVQQSWSADSTGGVSLTGNSTISDNAYVTKLPT